MSTLEKLRAALECPEATSDNESDYAFERGACRENARLAPIHAALIAHIETTEKLLKRWEELGADKTTTYGIVAAALEALDKALEET